MKPELTKMVEQELNFVLAKMKQISDQYEVTNDSKKLSVYDLEDMRRYSEIVKNLSSFLASLNEW